MLTTSLSCVMVVRCSMSAMAAAFVRRIMKSKRWQLARVAFKTVEAGTAQNL
jgi:hypothetical protein